MPLCQKSPILSAFLARVGDIFETRQILVLTKAGESVMVFAPTMSVPLSSLARPVFPAPAGPLLFRMRATVTDPRELGDRLRAADVSFAEVARQAGCSRALVSMQMHGHTPLTPRVCAAAEALLRDAIGRMMGRAADMLEAQILSDIQAGCYSQ